MLNPDFKELLTLFNELEIRYLLVGGYALAVHGVPRFTGDLDLWVECVESNARSILVAMDRFGLQGLGLTPADFSSPNRVVQIGYPPVRVDIMTTIDGVKFQTAWENRIIVVFEGVPLPVISREDLVTNKKATGRTQDLADLERLTQWKDSE